MKVWTACKCLWKCVRVGVELPITERLHHDAVGHRSRARHRIMALLAPGNSSHNPRALLASLVRTTGNRESATQLLRETLALAESVAPALQVNAVEVDEAVDVDAVEVEVDAVVDPGEALGAVAAEEPRDVLAVHAETDSEDDASVQPEPVQTVRKRKVGKGQKRKAKDMTAGEAVAQAALEGLKFIKSSRGVSGYSGVILDKRAKHARVYSAYAPGGKVAGACLGCFATAEEAALQIARHVGNTSERVVEAGKHPNTCAALRRYQKVRRSKARSKATHPDLSSERGGGESE